MHNKDIITISVSCIAIIISLCSFLTNHYWNKYNNHLLKKKIIREGLDNFIRKISDDYIAISTKNNIQNINHLFFVITTNFKKNKTSLILLLEIIKEKIIEEKTFRKSIFWCQTCFNFYKAEGIKLIYAVINNPDYGQITLGGFLNAINNNFNKPLKPEKLFEEQEWEHWYILLFNFSIDLFYLKKSLNEFTNTNFYDINNFNFNNWLKDISNIKISPNSIEYRNYIRYIDKFLKALYNPETNEKIKFFFRNARDEEPFQKDRFIIEQNFLTITKIFEWYKTQIPIPNKEILKKKNKIAFSISNCHFCIFINLGFYNNLTENELDKILKTT